MTNFLHWRKMTWAFVLWTVGVAVWLIMGSTPMPVVALLWVLGLVVLSVTWLMTQSAFAQGRGFGDGFFVRPGRGRWRLFNLHRDF